MKSKWLVAVEKFQVERLTYQFCGVKIALQIKMCP